MLLSKVSLSVGAHFFDLLPEPRIKSTDTVLFSYFLCPFSPWLLPDLSMASSSCAVVYVLAISGANDDDLCIHCVGFFKRA